MTKQRVGVDSRTEEDRAGNGRGVSDALGLSPETAKTVRVRNIALSDLYPDPVQPRRGMPEYLRDQWVLNPADGGALLAAWLVAANHEAHELRRPPVDPVHLLIGNTANVAAELEPGPYESTLVKLLQDAQTVYAHGLEHPITAIRLAAGGWQIQSGERRTLMHHALSHWIDDQRFAEIAAIEVDQQSVWKQAAENNARQDLTAIERARQLALLLFDCYAADVDFLPYEELPGQAFYQQAAELRVPRGRAGDFLAAMGLKNEVQLRQYRQLLRLPEPVWQMGDEHRWSENLIRNMLQEAKNPPDNWTEETYLIYLARVEAGLVEPPSQPKKVDDTVTAVTDSQSPEPLKRSANTAPLGTDSPSNPPVSGRPTPSPSRPAMRYTNDPDIDQGWQDEEEAVRLEDEDSGAQFSNLPPARPRSLPPQPSPAPADMNTAAEDAKRTQGEFFALISKAMDSLYAFQVYEGIRALYALDDEQSAQMILALQQLRTMIHATEGHIDDRIHKVEAMTLTGKPYDEVDNESR